MITTPRYNKYQAEDATQRYFGDESAGKEASMHLTKHSLYTM